MNYIHTVAVGRMTKPSETTHLPSGSVVGKFTVAVNRRSKAKDGTTKDETTYLDCVAWDKRAELIAKSQKGAMLLVDGEMRQENWEDKMTQQKRSKLVLVVGHVVFLEKREPGSQQPAPTPTPTAAALPTPAGEPDDVPL